MSPLRGGGTFAERAAMENLVNDSTSRRELREGPCNDLVVYTRSELVSVAESCSSIMGSLHFAGSTDVFDLGPLAHVDEWTSPRELVFVDNAVLVDIAGLRALGNFALSDFLSIINNERLVSLDGLQGLSNVGVEDVMGVSIYISKNARLASIAGLSGLGGDIPGAVIISQNPSLTTLDGLQGISRITGFMTGIGYSLAVFDNAALRSMVALDNLRGDLQGWLKMTDNPSLESIQGILGLRRVGTMIAFDGAAVTVVTGNSRVCATADEIRALQELCARSNQHHNKMTMCVPDDKDTWWNDARCRACASSELYNTTTTVTAVLGGTETCEDAPRDWVDLEGYECEDYQINEWCDEYGGDMNAERTTARQACCTCGGGQYDVSRAVEVSYSRTISTCGKGIHCSYHHGGRCECEQGRFGPDCSTKTATVSLAGNVLRVIEPQRGVGENFTLRIPLRRTKRSLVAPAALQLVETHQGSATPNLGNALDDRCGVYASDDTLLDEALEIAQEAVAEAADYQLLPPLDDVNWTSDNTGYIAAHVRVFHDEEYEGLEHFTLRIGPHPSLYPDCLLRGSMDVIVEIQDGAPGVVMFGAAEYRFAEGRSEAVVVLKRVDGIVGEVSATVRLVDDAQFTTASKFQDFDFESATVLWKDGDDRPKAIAVPLFDDDVYEYPNEVIMLQLAELSDPDVESDRLQTTQIFIEDDNDAGTITFSRARWYLTEGNATTGVVVERHGGDSGAVRVVVKLSPSFSLPSTGATRATLGTDYEFEDGQTLVWADRETGPRHVRLSVIEDSAHVAVDRLLALTLGNATGGAWLGATSFALVHIVDNDAQVGLQGVSIDTTPVIIATVAATVLVPAVVLLVYRHGHVASQLFASLAFELGVALLSLIVGTGDIVTDIVSCSNVLSDPDLDNFHTTYLLMTVIATIGGLGGIAFRVHMIRSVFVAHAGTSFRSSIVGVTTGANAHRKRWLTSKRLRLAKIRRSILSSTVNLGVFAIEDAPLLVFNIRLLIYLSSIGNTERDSPSSAWKFVLASMTLNSVMCGVKLASLKELKSLFSERTTIEAELAIADKVFEGTRKTSTDVDVVSSVPWSGRKVEGGGPSFEQA